MDAGTHAPDAAHAAAWGVVAAVQIALHVALVGVVAGALVPNAALRPLRLVRCVLPTRVRRSACVLYHLAVGGALLVGGILPVTLAAALVDKRASAGVGVGAWLCQRSAISSVYGHPRLVQAQAALLVLLFLLQFAERAAHAVLATRRVGVALRVARAFGVGGLWWATASAAPLSLPLGCALAVNAALDHLAEGVGLARGAAAAWYIDLLRAGCELFGGFGLIICSGTVLDCGAGRRAAAISTLVGFGHALPLCLNVARALASRMLIDSERLQRLHQDAQRK
jgi:hypothetical protein